jgi:hypothetical protein
MYGTTIGAILKNLLLEGKVFYVQQQPTKQYVGSCKFI